MKFFDALKLLEQAVSCGLIQQDGNDIFVWREVGNPPDEFPEGWYRENIMSVAQELMNDEKGQQFLKEEVEKTRKYQRYQLQWMLDHGYSLDNLICGLAQMQAEELKYGDSKPIPIDALYHRWVKDVGFQLMPSTTDGLKMLGSDQKSGLAEKNGKLQKMERLTIRCQLLK